MITIRWTWWEFFNGGKRWLWRREQACKAGRMLTVIIGPFYMKWRERGEMTDELREIEALVEKWHKKHEEGKPIGSKGAYEYEIHKRCAKELRAELDKLRS